MSYQILNHHLIHREKYSFMFNITWQWLLVSFPDSFEWNLKARYGKKRGAVLHVTWSNCFVWEIWCEFTAQSHCQHLVLAPSQHTWLKASTTWLPLFSFNHSIKWNFSSLLFVLQWPSFFFPTKNHFVRFQACERDNFISLNFITIKIKFFSKKKIHRTMENFFNGSVNLTHILCIQ